MQVARLLAVLSALGFGLALVSSRAGLRGMSARAGAAVSIPTATVLLALCAPFTIDLAAFSLRAAAVFALVGAFFPALVTLLTFRSNVEVGPTVTAAVSATSPLFALLGAALLLAEPIPARAAAACLAIVAGLVLISWQPGSPRQRFRAGALIWPVAGALLRGLSQAAAKAGLLLWPNPFAAGLIGYSVSSAVVAAANRGNRPIGPDAPARGIGWFVLTGILNGGAVLSMYAALSMAPVSQVAPVVATYPLVTALASAVALREERLTIRTIAGTWVTVLAVVYLVAA
jgi:drug/metabolite transporter (DMT)-like permease